MRLFSRRQSTLCVALLLGTLAWLASLEIVHAQSEDKLGSFVYSDLFLEPTYIYSEPNRGHFSAGYSYLGAKWRRDQLISAIIRVGSKSLIGAPARYGPPPADEFGLIEAYGQIDSDYGRIRAGIVPIPFGLEGGDSEPRLRFPRSLLYQNRLINLRDQGFTYRISNAGFFSDWAIHNGEGGTDLDNEMWFTARWGWQGGRFFRVGFSGAAGRTSVFSTNPRALTTFTYDPGLDPNRGARMRIANFFFDWRNHPFGLEVEATAADTRQDDDMVKMRHARVDLTWNATSSATWLARFDTLDPRSDRFTDQMSVGTLGIAWKSRYYNSVLYLLGSKTMQENVKPDAHRVQVIWRLTPEVVNIEAPL